MAALLASGRLIDIVLALTALEAIALILYFRRSGRGVPPGEYLGALAPGLCLLLALRCGVSGADWTWTLLWLLAALAAHLADLRRRWR